MNIKRLISLVAAAAMCTTALGSSIAIDSFAEDDETEYTQFPYTIEAEDAEGAGDAWTSIYETQLPGYSGEGFCYLTSQTISFEVTVPEDGMYEISARLCQILSEDGREQTLSVNGTDYMLKVPYYDEWTDYSFGMRRLKAGTNTISFKPQYGYAAFDTITVSEATFPDLTQATSTLCDPDATSEAQSLMNYLKSVYGEHIISGQQEIYGGGNSSTEFGDSDYTGEGSEYEFEWLYELSGEYPAIRGFDFMNYNPLYGWEDGTTERAIEWATERNGIVTASWHINVPIDFDSYTVGEAVDWTECTYGVTSSFNTADAIVEGTKENEYFDLAIEDLAEQLLKLQEANVPIIFRPLHEAEGNSNTDGSGSWFWWGKAGCETYVQIWQYLYNKLTDEYGLHNIIWEQNLYAWSTDSAKWYAGDDYVDLVGYDKYNTQYNRHDGNTSGPNLDAESSIFYSLVDEIDNSKMISMAENDTIPSLENLLVEKAGWLYFCPWYGEHILSSEKNDPDDVKEMYQSEYCITLDELPTNLYSGFVASDDDDDDETKDTTEATTEAVTDDADVTEATTAEVTDTTTEATEDTTEATATPSEATSDTSDNTGDTDSSDSTDSQETTEEVTGSAEVSMYGDVNKDDAVSMSDVVLLCKVLVGSVELDSQAEANADCNADGKIDASDSVLVLGLNVQKYTQSDMPVTD